MTPKVVEAQAAFQAGIGNHDADTLVFIDEAGFSTALNHSTAWSPIGTQAKVIAPIRAKNITVVGAISKAGAVAFQRLDQPLNQENFLSWLRFDLGPRLRRGDRVVMDNLRTHRMDAVVEVLAEFGASPLFIPPYSPEFNPIEMTWAWCKRLVRKVALRARLALESLLDSITSDIPTRLCEGWVAHCGYSTGST